MWSCFVRPGGLFALTALFVSACGDDGGGAEPDGSSGASTSTSADSTSDAQTDPTTQGETTGQDTDAAMVSYAADVRPIFAGRCTLCHHDNAAIDIDIADPFSPPNGLVGSINTWAVVHPEGGTPMLNVDPGNPEGSFLLDKIGDPDALDPPTAGGHMPANIEPLTDQERADLRAWIDAGASDDAMFADRIRLIFGDETTLGAARGKCVYCHHSFEGGVPPNLTDPFDPDVGAVGVASSFDPARLRIAPGDADNSVLVLKVEATEPGPLGGPMPPQYELLTAEEIAIVEAWIEQGAQDN